MDFERNVVFFKEEGSVFQNGFSGTVRTEAELLEVEELMIEEEKVANALSRI